MKQRREKQLHRPEVTFNTHLMALYFNFVLSSLVHFMGAVLLCVNDAITSDKEIHILLCFILYN